jgi:hypothetical protein
MSEYERGRSSDGVAPAIPVRPPPPEQKAKTAADVASNLDGACSHASTSIEAMVRAHVAHDVASYATARKVAEGAVTRVRDLAPRRTRSTPRIRRCARSSSRTVLAEIAAQNLAAAPPAPEPRAPTMHNESALLAALPPRKVEGSYKLVFDTARSEVAQVLRQMSASDLAAFEKILREFPTHAKRAYQDGFKRAPGDNHARRGTERARRRDR